MAEPWFQAAKAVALPPAWLWFRWRFEHLDRIPARGPALIACNHSSYLDPIANAYAVVRAGRRPRFLAKDDLFQIPIVGRALAAGVPITPMVSWGSAPVWQKSGPGSLKPGRPVWVSVGPSIDLGSRRAELDDFDAVRAMTAELMEVLTTMTADLRDRYPKHWAASG